MSLVSEDEAGEKTAFIALLIATSNNEDDDKKNKKEKGKNCCITPTLRH
jgi:hypothetical protein